MRSGFGIGAKASSLYFLSRVPRALVPLFLKYGHLHWIRSSSFAFILCVIMGLGNLSVEAVTFVALSLNKIPTRPFLLKNSLLMLLSRCQAHYFIFIAYSGLFAYAISLAMALAAPRASKTTSVSQTGLNIVPRFHKS